MSTVLTGQLQHVSLSSLLQLLDAESHTGTLQLGTVGNVGFVAGQPVSASCGPLEGTWALRELFLVRETRFSLVLDDSVDGTVMGSVMAMIVDGSRLSDEWARLAPRILKQGDLARVPAPARALAAACNGQRTVWEALRASGGRASQVVDPVLAAIEAGALLEVGEDLNRIGPAVPGDVLRQPTPPPAPQRMYSPGQAAGPAAVVEEGPDLSALDRDQLMERGRQRIRVQDWDGAEAAFRGALKLRPGDRVVEQNLKRLAQLRASDGGQHLGWLNNRTA